MVKNMYGGDYPLEDVLLGMPEQWRKEITKLYRLCEKHNVAIWDVKVKYGGLRFYVGDAPDCVHDAIDKAEEKCFEESLIY